MLSIVVVNYRTPETSAEALRAAVASAGAEAVERIVVDNGSTDESAAALTALVPGARVVREPDNRGFGAGVNAGVRAARGDRVLVLNSDAFCRGDAVPRLLDHLERHPAAGVVAPRLVGPDGSEQVNAYRRFPNLVTLFFDFAAPLHPLGRTALHPHALPPARLRAAGRVAHVMGAAWLMRREAYDDAGPFDESYFLYLEETEWQRRVARAGWEIHREPAAEVVHLEHGSSDATVISPHYVDSALRFYGRGAAPVMRAGARLSVASARLAARVRPGDERFRKLERAFSEVLARLPDSRGRRRRA